MQLQAVEVDCSCGCCPPHSAPRIRTAKSIPAVPRLSSRQTLLLSDGILVGKPEFRACECVMDQPTEPVSEERDETPVYCQIHTGIALVCLLYHK